MTRCNLGDHISIKHGFAFDGEFFSEDDNGVVLVTPGNFAIGGGYQEGKGKYFIGEYPKEYVLEPNALIVTMTDLSKGIDTLGYGALVPDDGRTYLHNQRIGLVEFKDDAIGKVWLSYLMRSRDYQRTIAGSSSGSTVHHTSPAKICSYEFDLPDKRVQKKIADVLLTYDKLIENNRKQIALLEEAAQRLYKEWFVDLRFPGYEKTKFIDGLPEGWKRISMLDLGDYLNGYAFKPADHFREGFPIIKIKELKDGVSSDTPRNNGLNVPAKYLIHSGDIIFSWSATLVAKIWMGEDALLNQHLFKVAPKQEFSSEYVVQSINNAIAEMRGLTTGSTMTHLQRNKLGIIHTIKPSDEVMQAYTKQADAIRNASMNRERAIGLLTETRDRLLPKLMSGEIEVQA